VYHGQKSVKTKCWEPLLKGDGLLCHNAEPHALLKPSTNWTLRYWAYSIQSWRGPFGLPLDWSTQRCFKRLPVTNKWRKLCIHGFSLNQNDFFLRTCKSLWAVGPSALKWRETMCKNEALIILYCSCINLKKIHCEYFMTLCHIICT
jgi:hypothetical protein